jgi:hypothetical protein
VLAEIIFHLLFFIFHVQFLSFSGRMLLSQLSPAGARPVRALGGGAHVGMIRDLCWSNQVRLLNELFWWDCKRGRREFS